MDSMEKLRGDNYSTWRDDVKVLLMEKGAWKFITGEEPEPDPDTTSKEMGNYYLRKDRAYSTIYLTVEKEYRSLISDTDDGAIAWKTLQEHFRPDTRANIISLLDQFFDCRLQDGEEIGLFAARLKKIVSRLQDAGHPLEDLYQAFQLIRYLPEDFKGIVQFIYRWEDKSFKFDNVLKELLAEESRLKQSYNDVDNVAFES